MRNNNLLKTAMAVSLSLIVGGTAQAKFQNVATDIVSVTTGTTCTTSANALVTTKTYCLTNSITAATSPQPLVVGVPNGPHTDPADMLASEGITYALEMFSAAASGVTLPTSPSWTAVEFLTTDVGAAAQPFQAKFQLTTGVLFDGTPRLIVSQSASNTFNEIVGTEQIKIVGGGNSVTFDIPASKTVPIAVGDGLLLLYRIKNAANLADSTADGGKPVTMTFKGVDPANPTLPIFSEAEVAIARSQTALSTQIMKQATGGEAYISVEDQSKLFTGSNSGTSTCANGVNGTSVFDFSGNSTLMPLDQTVVEIGCVEFTRGANVMGPDGKTAFSLTTGTAGELDSTGNKLAITGGQFAASMTPPGTVKFGDLSATPTGEDTVTFELTAANVSSFLTKCPAAIATECKVRVPIRVVVDGATEINPQEADPVATLALKFKKDYNSDALGSTGNLRVINRNGKTCMVWNIPGRDPGGAPLRDIVNIRVTNESSAAGKLFGKLWGPDGTVVAENFELLPERDIGLNETLFISVDALEKLASKTWVGRGHLQIQSTLADMEVLAMLRNRKPNSPLNNISLGAHGISCTPGIADHTAGF